MILPGAEGERMVDTEQEDSMTKTHPFFEQALLTLNRHAQTSGGHQGVEDILVIERLAGRTKFDDEKDRERIDAALYRAHRGLTLSAVQVEELLNSGNSPADKQFQNVVQGFRDRRAKRQENVLQEA